MANEQLEALIRNGLKYIEYVDDESEIKIDVNLLINVREFIFEKSAKWYYNKFPEAFRFDIGMDRKKEDAYYNKDEKGDGIKYFFNDYMELVGCVLYNDKNKETRIPVIATSCSVPFKKEEENKYKYFYYNEIDHFFTYCINNYMLKKGFAANEKGLKYIKNKIEKKYEYAG